MLISDWTETKRNMVLKSCRRFSEFIKVAVNTNLSTVMQAVEGGAEKIDASS